jgi:hypothetical protein
MVLGISITAYGELLISSGFYETILADVGVMMLVEAAKIGTTSAVSY